MKVSIFIPTFNSSTCISATLSSLISQTHKDIEILCVDDGSTDNTVDIIDSYSIKDSRIVSLKKHNEGSVPYSWNYVFPYIKGEFILYMSHDDILAKETIEKLVEKQKSEPEIDCVIPSLIFFENDFENPEKKYYDKNQKSYLGGHKTVSGKVAFDEMLDYSIPGFGLWRTRLVRKIGMPTDSFNSDEAMQRIWAKNCRKVAFSEAKFGYRQTSQSIVKGLKPYHYFSIATNLLLYKEMIRTEEITEKRKRNMQYKFFESLFYLDSCYSKHKYLFSRDEQIRYDGISKESYTVLRKQLICPLTMKGLLMKLSSKSLFIYNLLSCGIGLYHIKD